MHLTLLVPELIWPEPADQFTLGKLVAPGLQWLIAHAETAHEARQPFECVLASRYAVQHPAFGALRLLGEGQEIARQGHWLCADPVHLRFHHERIVLADAGAFDLETEEAEAVVSALNREFADVGRFHIGDSRHWYLRLHSAVDHPVEPISAMAGRRVDGALNGSALPLTRWLNEVQMFLHGLPVNQQRQAQGKPAINSLWLWGGGTLPEVLPASFSDVFSNNPLAAGLARAARIPLHANSNTLTDLLPLAGARPLVVLDSLLPRVLYEDGEGWRWAFEQMEINWFTPLRNSLGKPVDRISLIAPTIYGTLHYTVNASQRWKFWKSAPAIQPMAEALAGKTAQ